MTTFEDWLRRLAAAQLLVDQIPPAFRGLAWSQPVDIEGDYTTAALEGSVSLSPGAAPLVSFTLTGPTLANGFTTWIASLTAGQTTALIADTDGDAIVDLAAMFRLTPSGTNKAVLLGGVFTVMEQA